MLVAVAIAAAGCVIRTHHTIEAHVTIDIRQVDEQAENIVGYVTGEKETLPVAEKQAEPTEKKSSWLMRAWDGLAPMQVAYAAELKESSPKIKQLADQMRSRYPQVQALKAKGFVGETNRGYLDLVGGSDMKGEDKNAAQRLVASENADRKALYQEVVGLNKDQNVTLAVVERVFAQKWLKQARSGEKVQLPPAGDEFDAFKKSDAGKKLGDKAQAGAWVVMP
jgi:uncharacterized protein YdbL (DUF1318 family)